MPIRLPLLFGLASILFAEQRAAAQATDIKVKKPNVLLLLDNSGSMQWALDGSSSGYTAGAGKKARWTILAETLTGTLNGLRVVGGGPWVESNGCQPFANLDKKVQTSLNANGYSGGASGVAVAPFTWPRANGNPKDVDAVAFCQTSDPNCTQVNEWQKAKHCRQLAPGETNNGSDFSQAGDGLLDVYRSRLRFGVASFDTMDNIPSNHRQSSLRGRALGGSKNAADCDPAISASGAAAGECWGAFACQNAVDGSQCSLKGVWRSSGTDYKVGAPQWSYWHSKNALDTWLTGGRSSYATLKVLSENTHSIAEQYVDIGIRNSRAFPWRGRLIGFGPSEWDISAKGLSKLVDCADEDTCTELHNDMVQQGILGLSRHLEANTPLAAMMRDAYEFMLFDKASKGAHAPHDYSADVTQYPALFGSIGPQTDPFFASAASCRSSSIILVTDGEPWEDLDANMSKYADLLRTQGNIRTFVVGVGLDKATWNPTGSSSSATNLTVQCSSLTPGDLGAGRMCERDKVGGRKWKYADVAPYSGSPGISRAGIRACCNLLETAALGGTNRAYFPKDQAELKENLGQVLGSISGGAVSRTTPVFGGVAASFAQSGGSTKAPAISYEVRSSMDVSAGDTLWRGNIERLRYTCDGADNVSATEPLASDLGDVFADNITATKKHTRKFFTVVPTVGSHGVASLRDPALARTDGLSAATNGGSFARLGATDTLQEIAALPSAIRAAVATGANNPEDMLGLTSGDASGCEGAIGSKDLGVCAARVLRWFGGDRNPDDGSESSKDPAPSRHPDSNQCHGECSPLGAVYRSIPVFVPPPSVSENDDQNFSRARTGSTPSFVQQYAGRPTMVFSQTVDGLLHAFVVAKNEFRSGARFAEVPSADELGNNELWSFLPPAVMPSLWKNFNTHARLLDGQLAWANVVYDRTLGVGGADTAATLTTWAYATVVVGCSGVSAAGPFCYALDVTDPTKPRFLWQLKSAIDATGKPGSALFGDSVPGAAITHVRIYDPIDRKEHVKAVAIIPGGSVSSLPSGVKTRRSRSKMSKAWEAGASREPRPKIRDWGTNPLPARSLTFVELSSGRILARMVGDMKDNPRLPTQPATATQLSSDVVVPPENTKFDSPLTSIPVVYPGGNAPASRLYVGDADGTLWRVELHGGDPKKWDAHIAFDAYNASKSGDATLSKAWVGAGEGKGATLSPSFEPANDDAAALMGQPIQTSPILSSDPRGDTVVTFSTGDQENFNTYSAGMVTLLVSFPDRLSTKKSDNGDVEATAFQATMDDETGVELAFVNGARVTGPPNLFDGQLYFSYFLPSGELSCTFGSGGFCALDYLAREGERPVVSVPVAGDDEPCHDFSQGEVVFGMSINLAPSCVVKESTFSDPFLTGNYTAMTQATPARYELVFHTGQGGSSPPEGGKTKRSSIQLPNPRTFTQVKGRVRMSEQEL